MSAASRFAVYGVLGLVAELAFTGMRGRAHTTPWSFPIYGLIQPLYEPVHEALRGRAGWPARGSVYGVGFLAVEYACGRLLRRQLGEAPWDYGYARWNVDRLIRPDWFPLWAAFGLALEPLHDQLTKDG